VLKVLKPFVGPIVLFVLDKGLDMANIHSSRRSGFLLGFAAFWGVMALFSNRLLLRRFPKIIEWAPFLDPTGGFSTADQLTSNFIYGQSFHISLIAHGGIIRSRTFDDCDIYGPAILAMTGVAQIHKCTFNAVPEQVFIAVTQETVVGPILLIDCSFRDCRFYDIGIIGNEQLINKWRANH
jgi:hypothetical protein